MCEDKKIINRKTLGTIESRNRVTWMFVLGISSRVGAIYLSRTRTLPRDIKVTLLGTVEIVKEGVLLWLMAQCWEREN